MGAVAQMTTHDKQPTEADALRDLDALQTAGAHLDDILPRELEIIGDLVGLRTAIERAAGAGTDAKHTASVLMEVAQEYGAELAPEQLPQLTAIAELRARVDASAFINRAIARAAKAAEKAQPKKRRRPIRDVKQATARLQLVAEELKEGLISAAEARAMVYTIQTLIVTLKMQQPSDATIKQLHAQADESNGSDDFAAAADLPEGADDDEEDD